MIYKQKLPKNWLLLTIVTTPNRSNETQQRLTQKRVPRDLEEDLNLIKGEEAIETAQHYERVDF
jgi:hypothetical protein